MSTAITILGTFWVIGGACFAWWKFRPKPTPKPLRPAPRIVSVQGAVSTGFVGIVDDAGMRSEHLSPCGVFWYRAEDMDVMSPYRNELTVYTAAAIKRMRSRRDAEKILDAVEKGAKAAGRTMNRASEGKA